MPATTKTARKPSAAKPLPTSTSARSGSQSAAPAAVAAPAARTAAADRAAAPSGPTRPAAPAGATGKAGKKDKERKPKLKRDSFTIPKDEFAVLEALKQRAARAGAPSKKSEVLRAGIKALAGMADADFLAALSAVPSLKTGRPAKG